jgi:hypothetical protein
MKCDFKDVTNVKMFSICYILPAMLQRLEKWHVLIKPIALMRGSSATQCLKILPRVRYYAMLVMSFLVNSGLTHS